MEIINKDHEEVKIAGARQVPHIAFHMDGCISFSTATCLKMKIPFTGYLHFVVDAERLFFYIDEEENGYKLRKRSDTNAAITQKCTAVIAVLKKKLKVVDIGTIFPIKKATKLNDQTLFEILINKKIKK